MLFFQNQVYFTKQYEYIFMNLNTIHFTHKHPNVLYKNKNKITLHSIDFLKLRLFKNQLQHQLNTLNSSQQLLYRFRFIFKIFSNFKESVA